MTPAIPRSFILENADVEWHAEHTPFSPKYNDIYYPPGQGIEQGYRVFLEGNGIPQRWGGLSSESHERERPFVIGELGFGTGLNFLLTLNERKKFLSSPRELYYISFEKHPLKKEDLRKSLSVFPEFKEIAGLLLEVYPEPLWGIHRLRIPKLGTTLDLYFGDANELLREGDFIADAWYLDGFSPKADPGLWNEELFLELSRHSHADTTLASYSAAGWVRRSLKNCGWTIEKRIQIAGKRETLVGTYRRGERRAPTPSVHEVQIVGGGTAGITLAGALAEKGVLVTLLEREGSICTKASGNPRGVVFPYITRSPNPMSLLYLGSFLYARRFYGSELVSSPVIHFPSTQRLKTLLEAFPTLSFPKTLATGIGGTEVQELLGTAAPLSPAFFYPSAGWIRPEQVGRKILREYRDFITLKTFYDVRDLSSYSDGVLILANAFEAAHLIKEMSLPLEPVRGQIATIRANTFSHNIRYTLCYDGYFLPPDEGVHLIGASYDHHSSDSEIREAENNIMLQRLLQWVPECHLTASDIVSSRVAFRTTTKDRLPLVGETSLSSSQLEKWHSSKHLLFAGFGSRGLTTIPLLAEQLACQLLAHPRPLPRTLSKIVTPTRFRL